jgi:hypothetical protein
MGHANCSFFSGRTLFLIFFVILASFAAASAPAVAQTQQIQNDVHRPDCTDASHEKIPASSFIGNPGKDCATTKTDPAPVPPQIAPQNRRLFWVLPNYTTVEQREQFTPLSAGTKFKLSAKTMTDPVTVFFIGGIALVGQARNSDPTFGQGFQGYDKRFATFYADTGIGTLMTTSVFPTLLRQDPRYFQLGKRSKWHRALYAASRIFVAASDRGELQFNYSEIVGNAVAAGISNAYHPQSQRTLGNTVSVWGTDTMLNMLCNVAKEFWPDIRRKLHKQNPSN